MRYDLSCFFLTNENKTCSNKWFARLEEKRWLVDVDFPPRVFRRALNLFSWLEVDPAGDENLHVVKDAFLIC